MEWGLASTKAVTNLDGDSSGFFRSIHLRSFFFYGWSDSRGHHGTACVHGWSPDTTHLNTLWDELCQVNTRVGRIAWRQAVIGGFTTSSSPSPPALEDKSDDGSGSDDADKDDDTSFSGDDEMTAWVTCLLSFVTKKGSSFGYESSHVLMGREEIYIFVRGSVFLFLRDVVRTYCIFSYLYFLDTLFLHCDSKPCTYFLCLYILRLLR